MGGGEVDVETTVPDGVWIWQWRHEMKATGPLRLLSGTLRSQNKGRQPGSPHDKTAPSVRGFGCVCTCSKNLAAVPSSFSCPWSHLYNLVLQTVMTYELA